MFKNNKKQYINVLKQTKQLKIDYKLIENNKPLKQENSTFIVQNNNMPKDAIFKLDTLQKNIPYSYISSLYTDENQIMQLKENIKQTNENISLDDTYCISATKQNISVYSNYFDETGIDYLFSPFTILNDLIQNSSSNSLNLIVIDDKIFVIILNNEKQITQSLVKNLTPFENIQNSNFYNDEIIGQKLYDEVHFLEIQQILSDIIENYYATYENANFISKTNIFYTIKQLTEDQQDTLHENLMTEISYEPISVDEHIYKLSQKPNAAAFSYTMPREKKNNYNSIVWLSLLFISIVAVSAVLYYKISSNSDDDKVEIIKSISSQVDTNTTKEVVIKKVLEKLPNHNSKNNKVIEQTLMLFDLVPYDALLKELEIKEGSSTFVCNFIVESNSYIYLKEKLSKVYEETKTILKHENKAILSTIITNNTPINSNTKLIENRLLYKEHRFMHIADISRYLEKISTKGTTVKFTSKEKGKFLTFNYSLKSSVEKPQDFFDFIEKINKKEISINLVYPLSFAKENNSIVVNYNLQFHQQNKDEVKLPKN